MEQTLDTKLGDLGSNSGSTSSQLSDPLHLSETQLREARIKMLGYCEDEPGQKALKLIAEKESSLAFILSTQFERSFNFSSSYL